MPSTAQKPLRERLGMIVSSLRERIQDVTEKTSQTTLGQFPRVFGKNLVSTASEAAKSLIKSPLRLANTAYDLTQQIQGKKPSKGYDIPKSRFLPDLGKVEGYGRQFLNEAGDKAYDPTNLGTLAAGIKAVSQGILDTSALASIASKAFPQLNIAIKPSAGLSINPITRDLSGLKANFSPHGGTPNTITMYDKLIESGDAKLTDVFKDPIDRIYHPKIAEQIINNASRSMELRGFPELGQKIKTMLDVNSLTQEKILEAAKKLIETIK